MIQKFTERVFVYCPDKKVHVAVAVDLEIDPAELAKNLAREARATKSKKLSKIYGAVKVSVRDLP